MQVNFKPRKLIISGRQEATVARQLGGKVTAGSGNTALSRGDVKLSRMLIECKVTEGKSFSLRVNHKNGWLPIETKAQKVGKEPAMVIEVEGRSLAVVDFQWFQAAVQSFEKHGGVFL